LAPIELSLALTPRNRYDVFDVRALATDQHGERFTSFQRHMYASQHSTAGFLPARLGARLHSRFGGVGPYIDLFREMFPEGAGYRHDQLEHRHELAPEQKKVEPTNADSHLAFITGGLRACVIDDAAKPSPVYLVDLDGTFKGVPRRRQTTIVGYNREYEVARTSIDIPVSAHPIDAVNLRGAKLGVYETVSSLVKQHGVTKGRVRLELAAVMLGLHHADSNGHGEHRKAAVLVDVERNVVVVPVAFLGKAQRHGEHRKAAGVKGVVYSFARRRTSSRCWSTRSIGLLQLRAR